MNIYDSILSFHGTWRTYQARVLEASQSYLEDKKKHIVAAPGAGKTTLGIELIRRGGQPCLILSPRIVIRQQWLERIQTAFLKEGLIPEDYLSNNIQNPKLITSITYQTLFCGMTQYKGIEEEEDTQEQEEVDNKEMLKKSRKREALFQQWQKAVFLYETMETTEECSMNKEPLKTGSFFFYAMGYLVFLILVEILNIATHVRFNSGNFFNDLFFYLLSCLTGVATLYLGMELMKRRSPLKRLQNLGKAVLHALEQKGEITSACRVEVAEDHGIFYAVSLTGGTAREKHAFADCLEEMLAPVDNQRYLLCGKKGRLCMKEYYCVPTLFSSRKEDAQLFQKAAASQIGAYRLIYTRNAEGRKILLHARAKAFANRNERVLNRKKKVKGALE